MMPMVTFSALIDAKASDVWKVLKQFGQIHQWHPTIDKSHTEDNLPEALIGNIRHLTLADGAVVREKLLSADDREMSLSYDFEESPLPIDNYLAAAKVIDLTDDNRSVVCWSVSFDVREPGTASEYRDAIRALVVDGHNGLNLKVARS
ncbi:SRPBCC family protein [Salinicola halophyticus]|uniref:SRPBCC family protein n=1 Tax=Salinicola halophyticus TaxID=1808881 RepID=UPI003F472FD0